MSTSSLPAIRAGLPARVIEHPAAAKLLDEALAEKLRPCIDTEFIEVFADAFALHGVPARWNAMLPVYRKILGAYPKDILEAAILDALGHINWFPKVPEIKMRADPLLEERRTKRRLPPFWEIDKETCQAFGVSVADMVTQSRSQPAALVRQVAMYLCRQLTGKSLQQIGRDHGDRDHATAMHACRVVEERMKSDQPFSEKVDAITRALLRQ